MSCAFVRGRLSEWIDRELEPEVARRGERHVASCGECARRARELRAVGRLVAELPHLDPPEALAPRVLDRIDVDLETRRPALAYLFRSFAAAQPFMLPSLVSAALVLVTFLAGVLALDPGPLPEVHLVPGAWTATAPSGTESNPLFPSDGVALPRERTSVDLPAELLEGRGDGTYFLATVVARDGSVSDVTVLAGDARGAGALVDALRRQRFEPVRYRGRPVAVGVYRLISRMEVRSPLT